MFYLINIGLLLVWFLGYIVPYTILGFIEILLINLFLILLLNKIPKMRSTLIKKLLKLNYILKTGA